LFTRFVLRTRQARGELALEHFHGPDTVLSCPVWCGVPPQRFRQTNLARSGEKDAGSADDGALVLADAAADAEVLDHIGELDHPHLAVGPARFTDVEFDRLVRQRTMLLADQTVLLAVPGDAAALVEIGGPHAALLLFRQGQGLDGPGWADLAAEIAAVFAVSLARDGDRAPESLDAGFSEGGLQAGAGGGADLDALLTADAAVEELFFGEGAGRTEGLPLADACGRCGLEEHQAGSARRRGLEQAPAGQIDPVLAVITAEGVGDRSGFADGHALCAFDALHRIVDTVIVLNGVHLAFPLADAAFGAGVAHQAPGQAVFAKDAEKGSEGAEVAAPEAARNQAESDDTGKNESDSHIFKHSRLLGGQEAAGLGGVVERVDLVLDKMELESRIEKAAEQKAECGIEHRGEGAGQEGDRIEKPDELRGKESGHHQGGEDEEFP